jgi:transposase InsO family protein
MRFAFIDAEKASFPVVVQCEVLEVSRSGFYAWRARKPSTRATEDARLAVAIVAAHKASKRRYGSPRIHRALRQRGVRLGKKRVERLMRSAGLVTKQKRRFRRTTDSAHDRPIAPNLLARNFEPPAPNLAWAGDVTYIATGEGWAYLAVLLDLFSRRVVGWAMSATNDTELALAALQRAVERRRVSLVGLVQHTDRGSPYASADYRAALAEHGMIASMSRKADCWDNAVSESFFATLRAELVDDERFPTRGAAETVIGSYIEDFYNLQRLHSHLDYVSPIEFELKMHATKMAA